MRLLPIHYYHACSTLEKFEMFFSEDDDVPPPLPPEEDGEDIEIDIEDNPFDTAWPEA